MASQVTYGQIQEFDPSLESITIYIERIKLFFVSNDVAANKQVPIFLSIIGKRIYSLLRDLMSPDVPSKKQLDVIIDVLKKHFQPTPSVIAERFQFQKDGESVDQFSRVKRLLTHCKFDDNVDALRYRFMCGLKKDSIKKSSCWKVILTSQKQLRLLKLLKLFNKQVKSMKIGITEQDSKVNQVSQRITFFRCGKSNHKANQYRFRDAECHNCGKCGHLKSVCHSSKVFQDRNPSRRFKGTSSVINFRRKV